MRISIAMATYNGAKYLREQIDSILNQTIQDFELVVCDDCSTDETFSILKDYEKNDNRIKVYQNPNNIGFKKNFENVIGKCQGDLIALSDQDDIWTEKHLERLLEEMDNKVQIVCGRPLFVDEQIRELPSKYDYFKMGYVPQTNEDHARHILLGVSSYQGASMLIQKSFFEMALPIPEGVNYHDSWFAALACFSGGLKYVDEPLMWYRRYGNAVTVKSHRKSPFRTFVAAVVLSRALQDRLAFVYGIKERMTGMSMPAEQMELLSKIEKMLLRRKTLMGRIRNIPYYLKNFKVIYTFDGKHLFT